MKRTLLFLFSLMAVVFGGYAQSIDGVTTSDPTSDLSEVSTMTLTIAYSPSYVSPIPGDVFAVNENGNRYSGTITKVTASSGTFEGTLTFSPSITESGTYSLEIPDGAFKAFSTPMTGVTVPNFFTIVGGGGGETPELKDFTYVSVTPAGGSVVKGGEEIFFDYGVEVFGNKYEDFDENFNYICGKATWSGPDGYSEILNVYSNGENGVSLTLPSELVAGEYTLSIEPEMFMILSEDGETPAGYSEGVELRYTVEAAATPEPEVNYFEGAEFTEPVPGVVTSLGDTYKVALPKRDGKNCDVNPSAITVTANGEVVGNASMGFINQDGDLVFYTTNSDLTAPGEYIVTIPAGALTVEGTTNTEAITAVYTIEAPKPDYWANVVMTPAPGVVESLPSDLFKDSDGNPIPAFFLYIPGSEEKEVITVEDWSAISFTTTANEDVKLNNVEYIPGALVFMTDKFYTAAGEYTLAIPAGVFSIDGVLNPELVFNYTIQEQTKPELDLSYTVTPEDGAEVELPVTVTFIYSDEVALWQLVESAEDVVALYDESGNKVGDYELGGLFEEPVNEFYVNITSTDLTAGEYTLVVPAGVIEFNDANYEEVYGVNPEMTVKYVVKGEGTPEFNFDYVVTPEAGSTLDQTTTVVVKYSTALLVWEAVDESKAYLLNEEGEKVATYDLKYNFGEEDIWYTVSAEVTLGKLITGKYTFHIPAGTFELANAENTEEVLAYNEDINVEYNIVNVENGVEAVFGDAVEFTVYDLNGNVLVKNGDKSALENLANGVYVINGKKVILRR